MFKRLRLGLTALYIFAALALMVLFGAGAYHVLDDYFRSTTDLALRHTMAEQWHVLGLPLPPDLAEADREWSAGFGAFGNLPTTPTAPVASDEGEQTGSPASGGGAGVGSEMNWRSQEGGQGETGETAVGAGEAYEGELAAIFMLPLDARGTLTTISATSTMSATYSSGPMGPDTEAFNAAIQGGWDLRTVIITGGKRVRLLTYRVPPKPGGARGTTPAALQLGRLLSDQDRVLNTLLGALLTLGSLSTLVLAAASWWLSGRALRPAQLASERQQEFVANASHELRAPITLMRASAEVAMRGLPPDSAELQALLVDMVTESDHMSRLVEDLLLLSRIDAGRLQFELRPVQVQQMLIDIQRQARGLAERRGITLSVGGGQEVAWADATRLRQVLLIVLDNALRHTPGGGQITMEARPEGKWVQITLSDTGSGIAPEDLPHIFERFYRAANPSRHSPVPGADTGSGLGLSIARALMEAQGGHISIQSSPGKGTSVALRLPPMRHAEL